MNEQRPADVADKAEEPPPRRLSAVALSPHPAGRATRAGHQRLRELRILRLVTGPS